MKKIIAMAIGALFITVAANAQIQRIQDSTFEKNRPVHHKKMVNYNWNQLNLTDAQKKQIKENQESFKKQKDAVRNNSSLTQDKKKSKMMEIQKTSKEKNDKILTKDQKAIIKANQKEKHSNYKDEGQHHKKGQKGMKSQGMNGKSMKQLGLSQDQQSKMSKLRLKMREQTVAINNNTNLTEEQQKQQINHLLGKNMERINELLTTEQKMKMKENRSDKKQGNTRMKNRMEQSR